MDAQAIRELVRTSDVQIRHGERYEDSKQFVGFIVGPGDSAPGPVAQALKKACGETSCGNCCDSDCGCF